MNSPSSIKVQALAVLVALVWRVGLVCAGQLPDPVITASATPYSGDYTAANLFGPDLTPREFASRSQGPVSVPFTREVNNGTWVELDFGATVTFNQFVMRSRANAVDIVAESRLIVSADAVFDETDRILTFNPSGSNGTGLIQNFAPATGRYVRWEVTQGTASANLGAAQMWFMDSPAEHSVLAAPAVIDSAPPFNESYAAAGAVNGDVGNGGAAGHEYASQGFGAAMYIDFDFGVSKPISGFDFWNRPVDVVTAFDLVFADTPDFLAPLATLSFTASTDGNQAASATFSPVTARYVRLQATANQGGENTGVNEIQFYTPGVRPPEITRQPQGGTRFAGQSLTLSVQAVGGMPILYAWAKDGVPIDGATNATLTLRGLGVADGGDYRVVVSNSAGSAPSQAATVIVLDPPVDTATGLTLHLKLDESAGTTAADASPLGNHATLYNFTTTHSTWVAGRVGGALEFNRDDDPLALDDDQVITDSGLVFADPDSYTFTFWAKPYGFTTVSNPRIVTPWGATHWVLWKAGTGVGIWPDVPATPQPSEGIWRHFAVTFDRAAGKYSVYADGVLVAEDMAATRDDPYGVQWVIGHPENPVNYLGDNWRGALDDVRIYNRLLTPKDIRAMYEEAGIELPMFGRQPQGGTVYPGEDFTFTMSAGGTPPLTYQWKKDGQEIAGATSDTLVLTAVTVSDAGAYTVVVSNAGGSSTSAPAALVVSDPPVDVTTGLVMHLELDETAGTTAADASGTGNQGDLLFFPDPNVNWVSGILGGGLEFNSNLPMDNQAVAIPAAESLDFASGKAFSLAFWVKGAAVQKDSAGLICKGLGGGGEAYCVDYWAGGYRFFVRDETGTTARHAQTAQMPDGTWQLLGTSLDQALGRMRIYVNGVEAASGTPPTTLLSNADPLDIGCRQFQGGYTLNFVGVLDDVRVYNRALTPKDHRALYAMGVPPDVALSIERAENGVIILWPAEASGYVLESTTTLPGNTWTLVPGVVDNRVTITPAEGTAYYRLRKP